MPKAKKVDKVSVEKVLEENNICLKSLNELRKFS